VTAERDKGPSAPGADRDRMIHDYIGRLSTVPGWFHAEDVQLFMELDRLQAELRMSGDLLEIGVYQGKSAILLGYFVREGEQLVVCDLFGTRPETNDEQRENDTWYPGLELAQFERNYRRFHPCMPMVMACSSAVLTSQGLSRTFRFIHVDGSHQYDAVKRDIATVKDLLLDGGIVSFDDYRALHAPGVAAAVWQELASGVLRPLCVTATKLYATYGPDRSEQLRARLVAWGAAHPDLSVEPEAVGGHEFVRIARRPGASAPLLKRIYWEIMAGRRPLS